MSANEPMATPAGAAVSPAAVLAALADPFVTAEAIELVAAHARLLAFYEVRRELARHPRSPQHVALRLVAGLYHRWGVRYDLRLALARNPHTRLPTALHLPGGLRKIDLRGLAVDLRLAAPLRHRARELAPGRDPAHPTDPGDLP